MGMACRTGSASGPRIGSGLTSASLAAPAGSAPLGDTGPPLDIAFVAYGFPPSVGGTERYNLEYARRLHQRGHRLRVFTWGGGPQADADLPFEVWREPLELNRSKKIEAAGLERALARWQPEVVFLSRGSRKLGRVVRAVSRRAPLVLAIHDKSGGSRRRGAARRWNTRRLYGLDAAAAITANSSDTRARLTELSVASGRLAVVYPGVDPSEFQPDPADRERVSRELRLGGPTLLTVSRLERHKGHERVIALLPSLRQEFPGLVYLVVGDGSRRGALEELAQKIGVSDAVRFVGRVPDVRPYYSASDVFVLASSRSGRWAKAGEGFGISYAEAGACGLPSVASTSGGGSEIVLHGRTGWTVNPEDPRALEAALAGLLRDPAKARGMGREARRHVRRYDWRRGVVDLERVLRTAAARS